MEHKLLASLIDSKEKYAEVASILDPEDFSGIGGICLQEVIEFYEIDPEAGRVDKDTLRDRMDRSYPKHSKQIDELFSAMPEDVSFPNIKKEYVEFKVRQLNEQLAGAAINHDHTGVEQCVDAIHSARALLNQEDEVITYRDDDVASLVERHVGKNTMPLTPGPLCDALDGGLLRGSNILVFGRPDSGKTLFSIDNVANLCAQGYTALYFGNEDPADQMVLRFVSRFSGMTKAEVIQNPAEAQERARKNGYRNLIFAPGTPGTFFEIKRLVHTYNPDIVVIDQLRNINVFEANRVLQLEKAATESRNLGKQYDVTVINVTQAGDSAEDKLVLDMGDVDYSNTGIPGQMDLMIGIGTNSAMKLREQLTVSVCKNKMNGWYGNFPIRFDKSTSRLVD